MNRFSLARSGFIALALVSLVSLTLVACGDDDDNGDNSDTGNSNGADHADGRGTIGDIEIEGAFTRESVNDVAAVYMTITNNGDEDDTLTSVSADRGSEAQLHEVADNAMRPLEGGLPVPAGETVTLQTGGLHVMILGLDGGLPADGSHIHVILTFEHAGTVEISVPIESLDGEDHDDLDQEEDE